jgi:hypothetical protein
LLAVDAVTRSTMKLFVAGLLVFCAISLNSWQADGADLEISIPIQLTHAQNFDPSPSPDGKKLVFISVISGKNTDKRS